MGTHIELTGEQGATFGDDGSARTEALAGRPDFTPIIGEGAERLGDPPAGDVDMRISRRLQLVARKRLMQLCSVNDSAGETKLQSLPRTPASEADGLRALLFKGSDAEPSTAVSNRSGNGTGLPRTAGPEATMPATGGGQPLPALVVNDVLLTALSELFRHALDCGGEPLPAAELVNRTGGALQDNGDGTWTFTPTLAKDSEVLFVHG